MRYKTMREFAIASGADRLMVNLWKHRERIPISWQHKIVKASKGKVRYDDFWKIDWVKEKEKSL